MGLWTPDHVKTLLPALAVMLILAAVLRRLLKDKPRNIRMLPLQIIACILLALEVGKQVISLSRGYDLYHLPFHFCSLFIFSVPLAAFYKGKHENAVVAVTTAWSASLFLLMLIYPNLIYSDGNIQNYFEDYMSFHTVTFHNLVMLAYVLFLVLDLYVPRERGEIKTLLTATTIFCAVSATMAHLLKTNYANFYTCNIPVFEQIRAGIQASIGFVLTQVIYVAILVVLNLLFVLLAYGVCRLVYKIFSKRPVLT